MWVTLKRGISHREGDLGFYNLNVGIDSIFDTKDILKDSSIVVNFNGELNDNDNGFDGSDFREKYGQIGFNVKGSVPLTSDLFLDSLLGLSHKYYVDYIRDESESRSDYNINGGFELTFSPQEFNGGAVIVSYGIERNFSNDNASRYLNNRFNISVVYSY